MLLSRRLFLILSITFSMSGVAGGARAGAGGPDRERYLEDTGTAMPRYIINHSPYALLSGCDPLCEIREIAAELEIYERCNKILEHTAINAPVMDAIEIAEKRERLYMTIQGLIEKLFSMTEIHSGFLDYQAAYQNIVEQRQASPSALEEAKIKYYKAGFAAQSSIRISIGKLMDELGGRHGDCFSVLHHLRDSYCTSSINFPEKLKIL